MCLLLYRRSNLQRVLECAQKSFFFIFIANPTRWAPCLRGSEGTSKAVQKYSQLASRPHSWFPPDCIVVGRRELSFPRAVDWTWLCTRWLGRTSAPAPAVPRALHRASASANLLSRAWSLRLENRLCGVLLDPCLGPSSLPSVLEEVREELLMPSEQGFLNLNELVTCLGTMLNCRI